MIGRFSWEDIKWLAHITVWLHLSRLIIGQNTAVYAPITFGETVIVMLTCESLSSKHRHAKCARVIFCDRSIRRTVCSNGLVKVFACDVQQESCYIVVIL